jgi:nitrogen regulatory protein PII
MKHMVMLIMTNPDHCRVMLEAWDEAGAPGITILESTGLQAIRRSEMRDDVSFMPSLASVFRSSETHNRTMFSVVDDEAMVERLLAVTEGVFKGHEADHDDNSAVVFVLPVSRSQAFSTTRAQDKVKRERGDQ